MPIKLTIGLTKKVGQPNYGSLGAACHVEVELDSALLRGADTEMFQQQVRHAYAACGQAVDEELARQQSAPVVTSDQGGTHAIHHGPAAPSGNGQAPSRPRSASPSEKQLDYLNKLSRQIHGLGSAKLDELAQRLLGKPTGSLTAFEASAMIDQLKAIKDGRVRLEDVLQGLPV